MIPYPQINYPWSGDVVQSIDPDVFFGAIPAEAGDGRMEKAIVSKASYGRQLGLITEVLISLVEEGGKKTQSKDAFKDLMEVQQDTEKIKKEMRVATRTAARRILESLSQSDPDALDQIVKEFSARS